MKRKIKNQLQVSFNDEQKITNNFLQFHHIISDRGSKYSVSGGKVNSRAEIKKFLLKLKNNKKYAQASHNSWAARLSTKNTIWETKSDDKETGAGQVILRILQKENYSNLVVVVTRWFGGVKLYSDRFKHLQDSTKYFLKKTKKISENK